MALGNYEIMQNFSDVSNGAKLPANIGKLLGITRQYIGAYTPVK